MYNKSKSVKWTLFSGKFSDKIDGFKLCTLCGFYVCLDGHNFIQFIKQQFSWENIPRKFLRILLIMYLFIATEILHVTNNNQPLSLFVLKYFHNLFYWVFSNRWFIYDELKNLNNATNNKSLILNSNKLI